MAEKRVVLGPEAFRFLKMFKEMTGVMSIDVVIDEEIGRLIYVVAKGDLGKAVGRGGRRLETMRKMVLKDLGLGIEVVEYDDDLRSFIRNLLSPARVDEIELSGEGNEVLVTARVQEEDLGIAIGRGGRRAKRARVMAKRWFNVDNVKITRS